MGRRSVTVIPYHFKMLISISEIKKLTGINITGVVHVGGHYGQETKEYNDNGIQIGHFFEPQEKAFNILKDSCKQYNYNCYNVALGPSEQIMEMFVEEHNQGQSSSLLEPKKHLDDYPDITFTKKIQVPVKTLDSFNIKDCNFLNLDVQGFELEVLKGSYKTLSCFDIIYTEVNKAEMYKNCALVNDIIDFLTPQNFTLQKLVWYNDYTDWGEALFIKYK